ncbi:hypothetical protein OBB02_02450 [Candidatus Puniceispirillum sp.]|nr:hypothetical protein [Candidatus Puniceispirillum sp.]
MAAMTMIAAVEVGGTIGAVLRYSIGLVLGVGIFGVNGLLATLVVNGVGLALIGCLAGSVAAVMVQAG